MIDNLNFSSIWDFTFPGQDAKWRPSRYSYIQIETHFWKQICRRTWNALDSEGLAQTLQQKAEIGSQKIYYEDYE